jgi:hypothetical protein
LPRSTADTALEICTRDLSLFEKIVRAGAKCPNGTVFAALDAHDAATDVTLACLSLDTTKDVIIHWGARR